jgi:hypothetical protein
LVPGPARKRENARFLGRSHVMGDTGLEPVTSALSRRKGVVKT